MSDDEKLLPEEEAEMVAKYDSLTDAQAMRRLMALLISQIGFLGNVLISIDEKLGEDEVPSNRGVH